MNGRICLLIMVTAVVLLASSCVANHRPVITSLEAEADWTAPLDSLQVWCTASDSDDHQLSYEWSTDGDNIGGTGPDVIWTAPAEVGMYDITVTVDDGHGKQATGSIDLVASVGPPPTIETLVVTSEEPEYLKETTDGYKVEITREYDIECIASSTDGELLYEWACDDGQISGEDSMITWTAPDTTGYVTVTVRVFDGAGNWVRKSVAFTVVTCIACSHE